MGIYRYQSQQNGKLRDCSTQTKPIPDSFQDHQTIEQDPQSQDRPQDRRSTEDFLEDSLRDWSIHSPQSTQERHYSKDYDYSPDYRQGRQRQDRQGRMQRWLKRGRWVGFAMKNLSVIVTGGVVLVSAVALVGVWRSGSNLVDDFVARFSQPQPEPKIDMQPVLVQQLRNASELTTAVFAMQTVVPASRERTLGGYTIGKTTLLYIAYGEVRAGVDLSALRPEDVQINGTDNTISIRLPPPQILDTKIDVTRSKIYDYDRGFLGLGPDVAPELQEFAEQETLAQIVATACTQGVLQSANERAKLTIGQLLSTAGYNTSMVETQSPLPETCSTVSQAPESGSVEEMSPEGMPAEGIIPEELPANDMPADELPANSLDLAPPIATEGASEVPSAPGSRP